VPGLGRYGALRDPVPLKTLATELKNRLNARGVQIVGDGATVVKRAICSVGAAGGHIFRAGLRSGDVVVTGEIRHHDALRILRCAACAIALNHWTSERPALASLAARIANDVPGVELVLSEADAEPFEAV
jgi:putative NIF3 family GTP cyclohydrolase 1 type 2